MEYQYQLDPVTGNSRALFSFEHQVMGPWLEVEVSDDIEKIKALLTAIDQVESKQESEVQIVGQEYTITFTEHDVEIETNTSMNGAEILPEQLSGDELDFDTFNKSACGLNDFREMLVSWVNFIKK